MIKRPENLVFEPVQLTFNRKLYLGLEIDLDHINKGQRSNLTSRDVSKIVMAKLNLNILEPTGSQVFGNESCNYFEILFLHDAKTFKMVFCICSDSPRTIGVLTLYQVRKKYESL